jgi:hypothetical protein
MHLDRRKNPDRRSAPTRPLSRYIFKGRRRKARRREEDLNYYVDRYESRYLLVIGLILLFCVFDALLTLHLIRHGGREINPLMLLLLNKDIVWALAIKYLITAAGVTFFLLHKNFKAFGRFRINNLIYGVLGIYAVLVVLELSWYFTVMRIMRASP